MLQRLCRHRIVVLPDMAGVLPLDVFVSRRYANPNHLMDPSWALVNVSITVVYMFSVIVRHLTVLRALVGQWLQLLS